MDLVRRADHEAQVIERAATSDVGCLMQREVVVPGAQVDVLRVGAPHDPHAEVLLVEGARGADVAHAERDVAEPADAARSLGHARFYWPWPSRATAAARTLVTLAAPGSAATAAASCSTCTSGSARRARARNFLPSAAASGKRSGSPRACVTCSCRRRPSRSTMRTQAGQTRGYCRSSCTSWTATTRSINRTTSGSSRFAGTNSSGEAAPRASET